MGFITLILSACGSSKPAPGTESFIAPGYQQKKYKNILVLGTMKDDVGRKKAETALVDLLNRSGYKAIPSYPSFTMKGVDNRDTLKSRIDPIPFDAVIVLTYMGATNSINDKVSLASTTPITSLSFFDLYTSPSYDFNYEAQEQKLGSAYASFYTREEYQKQWGSIIQVNLNEGLEIGCELLAGSVLSRMKRDKIL
jgi:hypothetical protein